MKRELAEQIAESIRSHKGHLITVEEAKSMTKIRSDGREIYAINKGNITFLAWVHNGECFMTDYFKWFDARQQIR